MVRLRVKEVAGEKLMTLTQLQTRLTIMLNEPVYAATVRRYWHGTSDGKPDGTPIKMVDLGLLEAVAGVLNVPVCDLMEQEPGNSEALLLAA